MELEAGNDRERRARTEAEAAEQRADANAREAEANAELTLDTLSSVVFDVQRMLTPIPAAFNVRRSLLRTAHDGLSSVSSHTATRRRIDIITAATHAALGDVLLRIGDKLGLGRSEAARQAYERARLVCVRLASENPDDILVQANLSMILFRLGSVTLRLGNTDQALAYYEKSLQIAQRLAEQHPRDAYVQQGLTLPLARLGRFALQSGDTDWALTCCERSLAIAKQLAKEYPFDAGAQRTFLSSLSILGDVTLRLGDTDQALACYTQGLEIAMRLGAESPADAQAQRELDNSVGKMASFLREIGQLSDAQPFYEQQLKLRQSALQLSPDDPHRARAVAVACERIGDVCLALGDAAARDYFDQELQYAQQVLSAAKHGADVDWNISITYHKQAQALLRLRDYSTAAKRFRAAVQADGKRVLALKDLAWLLATCPDEEIRDGQRAIEFARRACELSDHQKPLYFDTFAAAYAEAGDFAAAVEWQEKALAKSDTLSEDDFRDLKQRLRLYQAGKPYREDSNKRLAHGL